MQIKQTKLARESTKVPTSYEFLKTQHIRSLLKTEEEVRKFQNAEAGVIGEQKMLDFLENYGRDHWKVLCNIWLKDSGAFECDLILITSHCLYLFEIKNYTGRLVLENGACSLNNWELATNPVHQTRRAFRSLKNIFRRYPDQVNIEAALVFIGECNQVVLNDTIDEFHILQLTDVFEYIKQIKAEEDDRQYLTLKCNKIIQHLDKFEVSAPFVPTPLKRYQLEKVQTGIYCQHCKSYDVQISRKSVICPCGLHEPREQSIVRTACEYGVLCFDKKHFTVSDISKFLGFQGSPTYIRKVLREYFMNYGEPHQKTLKLHNPKQLFETIHEQFHFKNSTVYYSDTPLISQLI